MMAVLESVAATNEDGARLADVVTSSGLNRATAYRFLKALQSAGLLDHDEITRRYFVGIKVAALAHSASRRFSLASRADSDLRALVEITGDTVYLTARMGDEAVCIGRYEGTFPIRTLTSKVGDHRPLGVGAGSLALLAFLPVKKRKAIMRKAATAYAALGLRSEDVAAMVERSCNLGYALNDGRIIPGMSAVALPLRDTRGLPVAAVTVAAIAQRMEAPRLAEVVERLAETRAAIEARYGAILDTMTNWR